MKEDFPQSEFDAKSYGHTSTERLKSSSSSILSVSLLLQFLLLFSSYVGCKVSLNCALNYLGLAHAKIVRWRKHA